MHCSHPAALPPATTISADNTMQQNVSTAMDLSATACDQLSCTAYQDVCPNSDYVILVTHLQQGAALCNHLVGSLQHMQRMFESVFKWLDMTCTQHAPLVSPTCMLVAYPHLTLRSLRPREALVGCWDAAALVLWHTSTSSSAASSAQLRVCLRSIMVGCGAGEIPARNTVTKRVRGAASSTALVLHERGLSQERIFAGSVGYERLLAENADTQLDQAVNMRPSTRLPSRGRQTPSCVADRLHGWQRMRCQTLPFR
jgi:hypothetical protein